MGKRNIIIGTLILILDIVLITVVSTAFDLTDRDRNLDRIFWTLAVFVLPVVSALFIFRGIMRSRH